MKHLLTILVSSAAIGLSASACSERAPRIDSDGGETASSDDSTESSVDQSDSGNTTAPGGSSGEDATVDPTATATDEQTGDTASTGDASDLDSSGDGTGDASDTDAEASDASSDVTTDASSSGASDDGGSDVLAVELGKAGDFVILAKSAISTTGATAITGDVGISPADATYITGFGLKVPPTTYSTSDLITGKVWASDYEVPSPDNLTAAVLDMEAAYTDAAGRSQPDYTELGAGNIDGLTLSPGLYKWGTGVTVANDVTLEGSSTDVWILQIGQDLLLGNGAMVNLSGAAQPANVFWQVAGQATLGTTSSFQGILLSKTLIEFNTGATMTGRALAQTAVTLDAAEITSP